ncbi:unnamed protein product [Ceutorhynchus assimilis]|uniref:Replication protein A3 n=1 Tax=Ceutorhynchus assimilis TaxID=467358 RepID=A0A9N9QGN6_9CUCU|nr:unnamed protein product [Ceutorhynchus assimilis]
MNFLMPKDIVNGAMLPRFSGKPVSIIGRVRDLDANGMHFTIESTDGLVVKIIPDTPINSPMRGWIEVSGHSTGTEIEAREFVCFDNEDFDCKGYNELCSLLYLVPNAAS